jgi:hypothetical protein
MTRARRILLSVGLVALVLGGGRSPSWHRSPAALARPTRRSSRSRRRGGTRTRRCSRRPGRCRWRGSTVAGSSSSTIPASAARPASPTRCTRSAGPATSRRCSTGRGSPRCSGIAPRASRSISSQVSHGARSVAASRCCATSTARPSASSCSAATTGRAAASSISPAARCSARAAGTIRRSRATAVEDLVLVLDVNQSYGAWLVKSDRLHAAMNTIDSETPRKRGLLLIEPDGDRAP